MTPTTIDRLIGAKVAEKGGDPERCYTQDTNAALDAASAFTRRGGTVRMLKAGSHVWEATAWVTARGRQHTESGTFPSALCRAMLAAVGVSVKSSDG